MKKYDYDKIAGYYDILEGNFQDIEKFNKAIDKIFKEHKVKSVLDFTCGTGNQAIYLHKKGYNITASDISKEMLHIAKKKYYKIKWNLGDIRTTKFGKFDAVISIFNAIGHLSKEDFKKAIKNVSSNLNQKGIYIFDIFNYDFMKDNFRYYEFIDSWKEVNGIVYVRFNKNRFDKNKKIIKINQRTYIQKKMEKMKILKESWDMKIYSSNEVRKILEENKFKVIKFLNDDGRRFDKKKSLSILTVARKN